MLIDVKLEEKKERKKEDWAFSRQKSSTLINLTLLTINAACHPYSTDTCKLREYNLIVTAILATRHSDLVSALHSIFCKHAHVLVLHKNESAKSEFRAN